ncbi:hypothetical protein NFI95_12750 [Acetobacteraceae bacterium KSS8]|uniref:Uncharacterized protein n=1 Tax=Endosaccharibacter trunci TaxID=2812733 RepID=A0ABT1W8T3_9PROT|nr:hypothetical protein [Acetobacteraceae bacterium KSS8]
MIRGAVDRLDSEGAVGWLYGVDYQDPPLVRAFLHHEMIGETVADVYRNDLEQVGFGDGHCGFRITFNRPIDPTYLPFVTIRPENVDLLLPLPPVTDNYRDLINNVLFGYPAAARNRSVLGGLWTDRLDAPQLLAGRVAVGSCPADLQPPLQGLIRDGHVLLHNALAPNGVSARDVSAFQIATEAGAGNGQRTSALSTIASVLFREQVVRLLRALFDDHPVAYRFDLLSGDQAYGQASAVEDLPSPNECIALYIGNPKAPVRLDCVRDSHDLPEFGPTGLSRWTPKGANEAATFAMDAGRSIETLELDALDIALVGPGMMHRVVAEEDAPAFRAILAPRRITPRRFLRGNTTWSEVGHVSGARIRV